MKTDCSQKQLLNRIDQVSFAVNDMTLYLDTHPCDEKALTYCHDFRLPVAIGFWPVCHFITKQEKTLIHKNKKDRTHFTVSRSFLPYSLFFTF